MKPFKAGSRVVAFAEKWRGKVRRVEDALLLIEWSYCGGLPTDICTWIAPKDIVKGGSR